MSNLRFKVGDRAILARASGHGRNPPIGEIVEIYRSGALMARSDDGTLRTADYYAKTSDGSRGACLDYQLDPLPGDSQSDSTFDPTYLRFRNTLKIGETA